MTAIVRKVLVLMTYHLLVVVNRLLTWLENHPRPLIDEPLTDAYVPPVPPTLRVIRADD